MLTLTTCMKLCLKKTKTTNFWKCWNSKLGDKKPLANTVNGISDKNVIAENFATYFTNVCSHTTANRAAELQADYVHRRSAYLGVPVDDSFRFDAELVESVIYRMKLGKAAGLDGLTVEHLRYCSVVYHIY